MALRGVAGEPGTRGVGGGSGLACMPWGQSVTHSLKLCRSLRRMSPMYSQATQRRKVRDSTPNQIQSHCKGAREKVVAIHTSGSESPTAGSSRGFLPGIGLLCRQLFPYLRELCFLGRESTPPHGLCTHVASFSPSKRPVPWTSGPPSPVHLAGSHPLFGEFPPVAAVQAVEAAGPGRAAAGGLSHGEGLGEVTLGHQGPWQKADGSLPPSVPEEPKGGVETWDAAQRQRLQGGPRVQTGRGRGQSGTISRGFFPPLNWTPGQWVGPPGGPASSHGGCTRALSTSSPSIRTQLWGWGVCPGRGDSGVGAEADVACASGGPSWSLPSQHPGVT